MNLFRQYRASLKNPAVEEWPDLFLFRPLAFILVKFLCLLPVTPNQISYAAMVTGIISAYFFSQGTPDGLLSGAVFYGLSNVIDCSDGMVARIKKNGTPTGRIIDGVVDYIVSIAVYVALGIGLSHAADQGWLVLPFSAWTLMVASGVSKIFQSVITDSYRKLYEGYVLGELVTPEQEIEKYSSVLADLNRSSGHRYDKFLIRTYLYYTRLQVSKVKQEPIPISPENYKRHNLWLIQLWNLAGPTAHIVMVMAAAFLYSPIVLFGYAVIFANAWTFILLPVQVWTNRRLFRKYSGRTSVSVS